jgi:Nuclease-related domain
MSNREQRVKGHLGERAGGIWLALSEPPQHEKAWAAGSKGEIKVAEAISGLPGVIALHDRRVRGTKGNIDHLVVSHLGVFVVDAKNMRGPIKIRDVGGWFHPDLRLYVNGRDKSSLAANMEWQVEKVQDALSAADIDPMPPITPVLCFIHGEFPLFGRVDSYNGVRLESARSLRNLLRQAATGGDPTLVSHAARVLASAFPSN